jgi:hypothetical protein
MTIAAGSGCRKSRDWSLTPASPVSLTLAAAGYPGLYVRADITLPERYERERGGTESNAIWQAPERQRGEGKSPLLTLTLGGKPYPNGCSEREGAGLDVVTTQQLRDDLLVTQCGSSTSKTIDVVNAFHRVTLPRVASQWYLWCSVTFYGEYEVRDIADASAVCSSIRWRVLEAEPPRAPSAEAPTQDANQ